MKILTRVEQSQLCHAKAWAKLFVEEIDACQIEDAYRAAAQLKCLLDQMDLPDLATEEE